jgi:hypothetical protein
MNSLIGFGCWLVDRLACDLVGQIPQLHAWWHVFVSLGLHQAYVCSVALHLLAPLPSSNASHNRDVTVTTLELGSSYGLAVLRPIRHKQI